RHDRRWFSMKYCVRGDETGHWPCTESTNSQPATAARGGETEFAATGPRPVRRLARSLVMVRASIPYRLDGVHGEQFQGAGLIVDDRLGLVVVDRDTVPVALAELTLTFNASLEVPGELVYLHPERNLAVVRYDPALIGGTPVRAATLRDVPLDVGDEVWMVGLTSTERVVSRRTRIARREPVQLPISYPPRFRQTNLEITTLEDTAQSVGGVLTDRWGRVNAFWASFSTGSGQAPEGFFGGISTRHIQRMVEPLREQRPVAWHSLGLEFEPLTLAAARDRGLSDQQARRLEEHDSKGRRVLAVLHRSAGSLGERLFSEGDLILSIDGDPVTRTADLDRANRKGRFQIEILREGQELIIEVEPELMSGEGTTRALLWSGALLQAPHYALSSQFGISGGGIYVSRLWYGSPSTRYRLEATSRIVEVDGKAVTDLDSFLEAVARKQDRDPIRLKTLDLDGMPSVITLKLDLEFWPTYELRRSQGIWERLDQPGLSAWPQARLNLDQGEASAATVATD
ncbi:MAG: hypothetical protein VCB25_01785, partial [Myxococcota bacterium]